MCLRVTGPLRAMKCPSSEPVSTMLPTPLFSVIVDHMLGPSFVSGGQQVFEFVRMMAHNEVDLRCAQLANASRVLGNLGDDILSKLKGLVGEEGSPRHQGIAGAAPGRSE